MDADGSRRGTKRKTSHLWNEDDIFRLLEDSDIDIDDDDDEEFLPDSDAESEESEIDSNTEGEHDRETDKSKQTDLQEVENSTARASTSRLARMKVWKKKAFVLKASPDCSLPVLNAEPQTPFTYFKMFFPEEFFDLLAFHTNLHSVQKTGKSLETNKDELMIFTGIQTLMGTIGMPMIRMYWSNSFLLPIISKSMTRNRFTEVRTHISFVNNLEHEPTDPDKLWKVRPLLEGFRKVCLTLPRSNVYSIDEQMIPFSGRCPARQYLPSKPNPVGLKVFVLAAPDGTMLDFIVYQGRGTTSQEDTTNFGAGGAIVKALVNTVPKTGCSFVFTDRYFTGLKIAENLLEQNIYLTGTIMKNRIGTIRKKLKQDKLMKRGDWEEWALEDESMCLLKWKDKKAVLMLSTAVGSEPKGTCLRWSQEERKKIEIPQPAIVNYYNKSMGGVDLLDRLVAYYRTSTRTCRWTLRVFLHLIDLGIVNSWTLYKRDCKASETPTKDIMKLMEFRLYIAEALIKTSQTLSHTAKVGRPSKSPQQNKRQRKCDKMPIQDVRFDGMNHFPEHVPGKFQSRCRNSGCNGKSRIKCRKCEVYLCLLKRNCFTAFHQK